MFATDPSRARERQIAELLNCPIVPLEEFLSDPAAFRNPVWSGKSPALKSPIADPGRVAVVGGGIRESADVRLFRFDLPDEISEYRPESIAGPVDRLRKLALDVIAGTLRLPSLDRSVVAFSGMRDGLLSPEDRELFWKAYRVPVFEQFHGFAREPLATECEAHDGLHVETPDAVFEITSRDRLVVSCLAPSSHTITRLETGFTARMETRVCGCGSSSPRLVGLQPV